MDEAEHTFTIMRTREAAVKAMRSLQAKGWDVYAANAPLEGQAGFRCVTHVSDAQGGLTPRAHSIFWNMYASELTPIIIDCDGDTTLLGYILRHAHHETFGYFEFQNDDTGFVCYCRGHVGRSLVLRIPEELGMGDAAIAFLWEYEQASQADPEP